MSRGSRVPNPAHHFPVYSYAKGSLVSIAPGDSRAYTGTFECPRPSHMSRKKVITKGVMAEKSTDRSSFGSEGHAVQSAGLPEAPADRLASHEGKLLQLALFVLMILALGLAVISWGQVRTLAPEWSVLPIGLVVLVALFGFYIFRKARQVAELRGLVRGLEQRAAAPPDIGQLEKLFGQVQHSQQGYRDLIDTFEDLLFSLSMKGENPRRQPQFRRPDRPSFRRAYGATAR